MLIASASNPLVRYIRQLRSSRKARTHEFFVEGVQAVAEAYRNGWIVRRLIYSPPFVTSPWAKKTLEESDPATRVALKPQLFERLSERDEPPELMAIVARPEGLRIPLGPHLLVIALDRIRNAGNLGSIVRSADAFGATGVLVIEPSVDIYDPKAVRATMGSLFSVPTLSLRSPEAFREWVQGARHVLGEVRVVGAVPREALPVDSCDLTGPTILLVGNEQEGLSDAVLSQCTERVSIPMKGSADSLNGAVAASICLYEATRQRRRRELYVRSENETRRGPRALPAS